MYKIFVNDKGELNLKSLNDYCYFCDFDKVIHRHHIIPSSKGGLNESNNILSLCPNCHSLIHKRLYYVQYSNGHFLLINPSNNEEKILPALRQRINLRRSPEHSLQNAIKIGKLIKVDRRLTEEVDNAH